MNISIRYADTQIKNTDLCIVFGCGGTGSWFIPQLIRQLKYDTSTRGMTLIGRNAEPIMFIADGDIVEDKNVGRQNFIPSDVGLNKAAVIANRYGGAYDYPVTAICSYIETSTHLFEHIQNYYRTMLAGQSISGSLTANIYIFDCVDNNSTRKVLRKFCNEYHLEPMRTTGTDVLQARIGSVHVISSANALHTGQVLASSYTRSDSFDKRGNVYLWCRQNEILFQCYLRMFSDRYISSYVIPDRYESLSPAVALMLSRIADVNVKTLLKHGMYKALADRITESLPYPMNVLTRANYYSVMIHSGSFVDGFYPAVASLIMNCGNIPYYIRRYVSELMGNNRDPVWLYTWSHSQEYAADLQRFKEDPIDGLSYLYAFITSIDIYFDRFGFTRPVEGRGIFDDAISKFIDDIKAEFINNERICSLLDTWNSEYVNNINTEQLIASFPILNEFSKYHVGAYIPLNKHNVCLFDDVTSTLETNVIYLKTIDRMKIKSRVVKQLDVYSRMISSSVMILFQHSFTKKARILQRDNDFVLQLNDICKLDRFDVFPEIYLDHDMFASELSCADNAVSDPQSMFVNQYAAGYLLSTFINLLNGRYDSKYLWFDTQGNTRKVALTVNDIRDINKLRIPTTFLNHVDDAIRNELTIKYRDKIRADAFKEQLNNRLYELIDAQAHIKMMY